MKPFLYLKGKLFAKKRPEANADKDVYEVASQYKLMWWKFKKHRLAMIAAPLLIFMYFVAIFCEFFAPSPINLRYVDHKNAPPSKIHIIDENGKLNAPFMYETKMSMNRETFHREYMEDKSKKFPIKLFVKGATYTKWGFLKSDIHLFGIERNPGEDFNLFLMGTDQYGRDLFSQILFGSQISLSFGLISIVFTFIIGLLLGGLSGYIGGIVDTVIQRTIDLISCIPTIPLWMALAAALPRNWSAIYTYLGMVLIMSLIGWTGLARVVRGKILSVREEDFVMSARLAGGSDMYIITRHLIPSFTSYIIADVTRAIPVSILGETSLSFLGLGLQAPVVSWGVLLQDSQNLETLALHPWLLWPAAFVIATVLFYNFLGDGLRDAADPYK